MWTRLFSLVFLAVVIWVVMEVRTNGTSGAFGGALAWLAPDTGRAGGGESTLVRVQERANVARDQQLHRIESQLGEEGSVGLTTRDKVQLDD
jgi:hypothetical protein